MKWKQTEKVLIIVSAFDQPQTAPMKFLPKKKQSLHSKWQFNTNQSKMTRNQVNGWITVFEHFCIKNRSTTIQLSNIVAITNCTIRSILPLPRKLWHNSTPIMLAIIVHVFHLSEEIASPHQNGTKRHVPWDHQYFINFMNFRNAAPQISWYMVFFSGISWNNFAEKNTQTQFRLRFKTWSHILCLRCC